MAERDLSDAAARETAERLGLVKQEQPASAPKGPPEDPPGVVMRIIDGRWVKVKVVELEAGDPQASRRIGMTSKPRNHG